jgi:quinol monooxygenase YgiN
MSHTEHDVVLYAEITAKRERADRVESLLREYAETVRAEPGNVVFDVYRRSEAAERFFVFETYRDRAAFEQHLAAPAGRRFNEKLGELIEGSGSQLSFLTPAAR